MNVSTRTSVSASANYGRTNFTADRTDKSMNPARYLRWLFVLCLMLSVGVYVQGQTLANYTFSTATNASLEDLSSGSTNVMTGNNDDAGGVTTPIGFNFLFMGQVYTHWSANSNGQMRLHTSSGATAIGSSSSSLVSGQPIFAPFAGDNEVNNGIRYKVIGTAPNRKLVVEWNQFYVNFVNITNAGNMQVWLSEANGEVDYVYGEIYNSSSSSQTRNIFFASSNTATTAGSITINTSPTAPTFALGTTLASNTIAAGNGTSTASPLIDNIGSSAQGSRRIFSWVPSASIAGPSSLSFTNIGLTTMTLNWVASSPLTNVLGYIIYASSDGGVTYNPVSLVSGASTVTANVTGLTPNTTYLWQVYAYAEGNLSATYADGVQGTNSCAMSGTYSVGPTGTYTTLTGTSGALAALAAQGAAGPVIFELASDYVSTGETYPMVLPNVPCVDATNTVTIRPATGATGLSISGSSTTALIDINAGHHFIIDGRAGGSGASQLSITNTASGPAIRFINEGSNNIVRYTTITSASASTTSGAILFSTTTGANGNDNNTITNNDINGNGVVYNLLYCSGTTTTTATNNSGNIISNNSFHDQFSAGSATHGLYLSSGATDWTITANSFYQSASRTYTSGNTHYGIRVATGNNHIITNNYVGGSSANAGGSAYTMAGTISSVFVGIASTGSTTTANTITGNTVSNFSLTTASTASSLPGLFAGIYVSSGLASVNNNTIGTVAITTSASGGVATGIGCASSSTGNITINNNTISGYTMNGTTTGFANNFNGIWNTGSLTGSLTISGNTVGHASNANSIYFATASTTGGNTMMGIYNTGTPSTGLTVSNNTIANFTSNYNPTTATTAAVIRGIYATSGAVSISGNSVHDLTANANSTGTGSSAGVQGISVTTSTSGSSAVTANTIYSLINNHATSANLVTGIFWNGPTAGGLVNRNLIYSLQTPSTIGIVSGISVANLATVQNNMIRLGIDATGASRTTATQYNGILVASASNIWHNTVYIGGTGVNTSPATATYAYFSTVTTGTSSVLNNIFMNARSSASAGGNHYAIRLNSITGHTINNNIYYAPGAFAGVLGSNNGTDVTSLAAWQGFTSQDGNSKSADVCLANPTAGTPDLHLTDCSAAGSPADGAGIATSVTVDFDNETRSGLTPIDIGADAGNYGLIGVNVGLSALVSPAAPSGCYTSTESVVVTLNNYGVNTIDFSVNPVTVNVTTNTGYNSSIVINSGTLAAAGTQNVTMPATIDMTATANYTFNGTATVAGDVNTANDAMPSVSRNYISLGGTYTVGSGGNYATLTAAVAAWNAANCLTGAVTFSLTDAAYATETYPIVINQHAMGSATNTLTIKPATGVTATFNGTSTASLIKINGADYVTIDGSNNGSSSRDLSFTNAATTGSVINVASIGGVGNGANFVTIKNLNVKGGSNASGNYGIISSASSSLSTSADDNDNLTIQNNDIQKVYVGIQAFTATTAGVSGDNLVITGNSIGSNTVADYVLNTGIVLSTSNAPVVSNNTIFNMIHGNSYSSSAITIADNVIGGSVTGNIIRDIQANTTSGYGAYGINFSSTTNTTNVTVANNMISGILTANYSATSTTFNAFGIRLTGGTNLKVYHNTVNLYGDVANGSSIGMSAAMLVTSTSVTGLDLRNNIFTNTQNFGVTGSNAYSIYAPIATLNGTYNYNNYSGANGSNTTYRVGYLNATAQTTLANWQSATSQDANSTNFTTTFTSPSDLHLVPASNSLLDNKGTNVGVATDIDGDTRSGTTPDMGVDEFTAPVVQDVSLTAVVAPGNSGCYSATEAVTVTVLNNTNFPLDLSVNPVTVSVTATGGYSSTTVINSGIIAALGTQNVTMPATIDLTVPGTYVFNGSATVVGDVNTSNDALTPTNIVSAAVAVGTVSASPQSYCTTAGTPTLTLSSAAGGTIQWQESTVSATGPWTNVGTNALTYTPSSAITGTTYYQAVVSCSASSTSVTSNVVTVNLYSPVVTGTTPGSRCGPGTVTLGAAANAGYTLSWYASASGGVALGTGTSFTTPSISSTTSYYVAANNGGSTINGGKPSTNGADGTNTGGGIYFTANTGFTLNSVKMYPTGSGTNTIVLYSGSVTSGTPIYTATYTFTGANTSGVTVPLNWAITPGTYTIYQSVGNAACYRDFDGGTSTPATAYPYNIGSAVTLTNGTLTNYYYFFYDWSVSTGCESARTEVVATVNTAPSITPSSDVTICNGQSTNLNVTSSNDPDYTYTWTPGTLAGAAQTVSPTSTTVYTVNAVDNTAGPNAGCTASGTVTVTVNPTPTAVTAGSSTDVVCVGGTVNLTSSANSGENNSVNYAEGFESGIPGSWSVINAGSGNIWTGATSPTGGTHTGTGAAQYLYNSSFAADTWMITQGFNLISGVPVTITFWENTSGTFPEKLKVTVGSAQNIAGQTTTLVDYGSHALGSYTQRTISYTPSSTGTYYFGFHCYSDADEYYLNIDDLNISYNASVPASFAWTSDPAGFTSSVQNPTGVAPTVNTTYTVTASNSFGCSATASKSVTISDLAVSASASDATCNGASTGSITATATGGTTPYEFSLNGTTWQSSNTFNGLAAGTYTVQVRDANTVQCTVLASPVTVNEPTAIVVSIGGSTDPVCYNSADGTISASATGGTGTLTYTIDGPTVNTTGASTGNFTGLTGGSYTITATDANNCTAVSTTVVLTAPAAPSVTASNNGPVCSGSDATLTATSGYASYAWTGPGTITNANTESATAVTPTDGAVYTVTITDGNGCQNTATTTVSVVENAAVSVSIAVSPSQEICSNAEVTFTATPVNGGSTPTYQWYVNGNPQTGETNSTFVTSTVNDQDEVYVEMTSSITCTTGSPATSNSIVMTVTGLIFADASITASSETVCDGTSVTLTGSGNGSGSTPTYDFYVNNNLVQSGSSATYTYVPVNGDEAYVVITSSFDCAIGSPATSGSVVITVNPVPAAPTVSLSGASTFCDGGSVTLTSDYVGGNLWSPNGETTDAITVSVSGTYSVTQTQLGCTSAPSTPVVVTVNANPTATVTGASNLCAGSTQTLSAATSTAGSGTITSYQWTLNGSTSLGTLATQDITAAGSYTVTVTNSNGCSTTSAAFVVTEVASPTVSVATNCTTLAPGATATLTATSEVGVSYAWTLNGGPVLSTTNPYTTDANAAGTYAVTVTNANACTATATVVISNLSGALAGGSTYTIGATCGFPTIASAASYLNANGVTGTGAITFNVPAGYTETAAAGGIVFGSTTFNASQTSATPVIFQKSGSGANPKVTASAAQTSASISDAVIKLVGADYMTFDAIDVSENAANTTIAPATNNMTEFGYGLFYLTATDGAQNNTIQNSSITMNRTYTNSFGIYSNTRHTATAPGTVADITAATGSNSGTKIYGNSISNVNVPIALIGCGATGGTDYMDQNADIGGTSAGTGNTLTNWGGFTAGSTFAGNSTSNHGIFILNQLNDNISYNSITSAAVSGTSVTLRGILKNYTISPASVTTVTNINNNTITLSSGFTSGALESISNQGISTALATSTININNNNLLNTVISGTSSSTTFVGIANLSLAGVVSMSGNTIRGVTSTATTGGFTGITNQGAVVTSVTMDNNKLGDATAGAITFSAATSGAVTGINNTAAVATVSISGNDIRGIVHSVAGSSAHTYFACTGVTTTATIANNTFTNLNVNTTGTTTFISTTYTGISTCVKNITGNSIVTAFNRGGASGSVILATDNGSTVTGAVTNCQNNNFSNITVTGSTSITGLNYTDGGSSPAKVFTGNTLSNWTGGTGTINAVNITYLNGVSNISSNTISNLTNQGTLTGMTFGSSANNATSVTVSNNTISTLASTGTGGTVTGITCSNTSTGISFTNNNINTLSSTGASSSVIGLAITGAVSTSATGNTISGLTASGTTSPTVTGMSVSSGTSVTFNGNTISGLSNAGATTPTTRGILVSGGTTINVSKNKIYDLTISAATTATAPMSGIAISSGTTVNTSNNIIGDLKAPAANTAEAIRGINITSTSGSTTQNVSFNTIYLNASSTGTNFGATAVYATTSATATSATLNLRSNIIANLSTPSGTGIVSAYRRSSATLTNYGAASNNNLFYAGTAATNKLLFYDGTNSDQTLSALKTRMATRDQQSVSEDPSTKFLSTTGSASNYLHIDPSIATAIEGNGIAVSGITDDFDGDTRTATPDIGADEFTGTPLPCTGAIGGTITPATLGVCSTNTVTTISSVGASTGGGITYQWMVASTSGGTLSNVSGGTGANTPAYTTPTGMAVGTYYYKLMVTCSADPLNPAYSNEFAFTVKPVPTASASSNSPVCSGSTLNLTGTTDIGATFAWTGPNSFTSTSQNPTISSATTAATGTYSFTATLNGCTSTASTVAVTVNETPGTVTVTPASAILCEGATQVLTASGGTLVTPIILSTEDFNAPTNTWTTVNNSTGGTPANTAWTLRPDGYVYSSYGTWHSNDNSQFYLSNQDAAGSGSTTNTELKSAAMSTVGLTDAAIGFYHLLIEPTTGSSTATVEASTDGTNWTVLQTYTSGTNGTSTTVTGQAFQVQSVPLTAPFLNQATVYVRFKYTGAWRYFWGIDNVSLTKQAVAPITWSPSTGLYTDAAATIPYAGEALSTVYAKSNTNASFTATATNNGCTSSATANLTVNPAPAGNMENGSVAVCQDATSPTITFTGTTGTAPYTFSYTINGGATQTVTTASGANPQSVTVSVPTATPGTFTYALTNVADIYCATAVTGSTYDVTVNALPTVSFTGLPATACVNGGTIELTPSPTGGTFSGTGISGNVFDPAAAGVGGPYTITYTYSNGTCSNSYSQTITVNAAPTVSFTGLAANYCTTDAAVTLTGSPAGGTFTGTGISGDSFDPAVAGAGTFTITYSYTNGSGCTATSTQEVTVTVCPTYTTLNMKMYLQGYYAGSGTMQPVMLNEGAGSSSTEVDNVTVEIHDGTTPSTVLETVTGMLNTDGTISVQIPATVSGSHYVAIKHRNTIQTWTAGTVNFAGGTITYDFTTAASQAYGDNQIEVETGVFAFYSGDINQDESIDISDYPQLDTDVSNFEFGYFTTDLNGDGSVDIADYPVLDGNVNNFIFSAHP